MVGTKTALIWERHPPTAHWLRLALCRWGWDCVCSHSSEEGWNLLSSVKPAVLLLGSLDNKRARDDALKKLMREPACDRQLILLLSEQDSLVQRLNLKIVGGLELRLANLDLELGPVMHALGKLRNREPRGGTPPLPARIEVSERIDVVPGMTISTWSCAASGEGGDICHYYQDSAGNVVLELADIAGHGEPVSAHGRSLKRLLESENRREQEPWERAAGINERWFMEHAGSPAFSLICARVMVENREVRYTSCGHLPPILFGLGKARFLKETGGVFLGATFGPEMGRGGIHLQAGEHLLFMSDGLVEAADDAGEAYGENRLLEFLDSAPQSGRLLLEALVDNVRAFTGRNSFRDDATLLLLEDRRPSDAPALD